MPKRVASSVAGTPAMRMAPSSSRAVPRDQTAGSSAFASSGGRSQDGASGFAVTQVTSSGAGRTCGMASGPGVVPGAVRGAVRPILPRPDGAPAHVTVAARPGRSRYPQLPVTPSESRVSFTEDDCTVIDARPSATVTSCTWTPAGRYCATHTG